MRLLLNTKHSKLEADFTQLLLWFIRSTPATMVTALVHSRFQYTMSIWLEMKFIL